MVGIVAFNMHTVFDFAAKRAEIAPEAIAIEEADGRRRLTFAQFNERAERGAAALERMGVAAGERVAILCHNSVLFFEVLFACGKVGAILVPLNWRQTPAELAPILADCGARILLHDAATAPLAGALAKAGEARLVAFDAWERLVAAHHLPSGFPPPLTPPRVVSKTCLRHEGEGIAAALWGARATPPGRRTASGICSTPPAPPAGPRR